MKLKFRKIPVKHGDYVYLNYMDFGNKYILCRASSLPIGSDQIIVEGAIHHPKKDWNYSSFCIGLSPQFGQKKYLFDFIKHKDWTKHRPVWIAKWNPHN